MKRAILLCASLMAICTLWGCPDNGARGTADAKDATDGRDDVFDSEAVDADADTSTGPVDTSNFSGTLLWTEGDRGALAVRDLGSNQITTILARGEELASYAADPDISRDRDHVVFIVDDFDGLGGLSRVQLVDLNTNRRIEAPNDFESEAGIRESTDPSVSGDGSLVAFSQDRAYIDRDFTGRSGDSEIAVWDGESTPRVIANVSEKRDRAPVISADGSQVLFLSEIVGPDSDGLAEFYMVPADGATEPRRISYDNYTEPLVATRLGDRGAWSTSDDLSWLAFAARLEGTEERGAFLLNTETGDVDRLGAVTNVKDVDIAADGSSVVVVTGNHAHLSDQTGWTMELFDVMQPSDGTVIAESADTFCASVDLSQRGEFVTYMKTHNPEEPAYSLHLMRSDGSDDVIIARKDGLIGLTTGEITTDFR